MRILAVDDDPIILEMLEQCLPDGRDIELVCCSSGEEALERTAAEPRAFDCLLLDIMMPGIDGIDLCGRLRANDSYKTTPIIMITASREPDLMARAFRAGATDFLPKPLDGIELHARINAAAMLNESLHRERAAQVIVQDLSQKLRLPFEAEFDLDVAGVGDAMSLENALLRMPEGCYAMTLFTLDIVGLRGIHKVVSSAAFRAHVEAVGLATTDALEGRAWRLAYAGSGRFVGVVMGRARFDLDVVLDEINATLALTWDEQELGTPQPPTMRLNKITEQRLWSGLSASDKFRAHLENRDTLLETPERDEDELFQRFDKTMCDAA